MHTLWIAAAFLALAATPVIAQPGNVDYLKLQQSMQAAQAHASHAGDDALDCAGLENEMIAITTDPALKEQVAELGDQTREYQAGMTGADAQISIQTALSVYASLVPGGGWAQLGAAQAQMPAQRAQAAKRQDQIRSQGQAMMPFLPQMMRGQRVIELAQQRECAWVVEAMGMGR
jgi:hypothetical protein